MLVVAVFCIPRFYELDRMVTPDEPIWLARSANFYEALSSQDWQSTYQFAHPGVTVMWAGAIGYRFAAPDYPELAGGQISQRQNVVAGVLEDQARVPLDVLVAGRQVSIVLMAIVFALAFWMALRLLGFFEVTLGFLLIALEPFTLALTRLLHVDGMSSIMMLFAVLAFLVYLIRGRKRRDLVIAGIGAGLSVLTRSQLGILFPWVVLLLVLDAMRWRWQWPGRQALIATVVKPALVWGIAAAATAFVLWPALWVDPIGVARGMLDFAETAAIEGHEKVIYFVGVVIEGDPGPRFYPTTFFWRATPATVIGIVLAVVALARSRRWQIHEDQVRILLGLLSAVALYGGMMTLAAKKFDRYLLPVYPLLGLVAAWGIITVGRRLGTRFPGNAWIPAAAGAALALLVQVNGVTSTQPYYLDYYSPALGGTATAPETMMVGWGEGLDQVAAYLNDKPDAENLVAATESWRTPLSYFFDGDSRFAGFVDDAPGIYRWARSDYYIRYITPLTRNGIWPGLLEYVDTLEPELVVTLNGLEYAAVYDISDQPLPAYMESERSGMVHWQGVGRLVAGGGESPEGSRPGNPIDVTLYFDGIEPDQIDALAEDLILRLRLRTPYGELVATTDAPFALADPVRHGLYTASQRIMIPTDAARGTYRVEVQLVDRATGLVLPVYGDYLGVPIGESITVDRTYVYVDELEQNTLPEEDP